MSAEITNSLINGGFLIAGTLIALGATFLRSFVEDKRRRREKEEELSDREHAALHGTFALTNFVNGQLNAYDKSRNIYTLTHLTVAQSYMTNIVQQLPADSYRLRALLVGLGLRLEALLFIIGGQIGEGKDPSGFTRSAFQDCLEDFETQLASVDALLSTELPILSYDELAELGIIDDTDPDQHEENK